MGVSEGNLWIAFVEQPQGTTDKELFCVSGCQTCQSKVLHSSRMQYVFAAMFRMENRMNSLYKFKYCRLVLQIILLLEQTKKGFPDFSNLIMQAFNHCHHGKLCNTQVDVNIFLFLWPITTLTSLNDAWPVAIGQRHRSLFWRHHSIYQSPEGCSFFEVSECFGIFSGCFYLLLTVIPFSKVLECVVFHLVFTVFLLLCPSDCCLIPPLLCFHVTGATPICDQSSLCMDLWLSLFLCCCVSMSMPG